MKKPGHQCQYHRHHHRRQGQALVEFIMVMPILILILTGSFLVGWAMYVGANAASAIKEPVMQKLALADIPGATLGQATSMVQAFSGGSFNTGGSPVDSVAAQFTNNVTAVLVGTKNHTAPIPGLPLTFNFVVTQGINANLLKANDAAGATGGPTTLPSGLNTQAYSASSAGGGIVDPTRYGIALASVPASMQLADPSCGVGGNVTIDNINTIAPSTIYTIGSFSAPATMPPVGSFSATYSAPTHVNAAGINTMVNMANTACDAPDSLAKFQTECESELAALSTSTTAGTPTTDPVTGVTTVTNSVSNSPAIGQTTTTTTVTYPAGAVGAPTTAGTTNPDPNTTVTVTIDATTGVTTQVTTAISSTPPPAGTGTGDTSNPAAFVAICKVKKQAACHLQLGNMYMTDVMTAMTNSGGCGAGKVFGTGGDVNFASSNTPY